MRKCIQQRLEVYEKQVNDLQAMVDRVRPKQSVKQRINDKKLDINDYYECLFGCNYLKTKAVNSESLFYSQSDESIENMIKIRQLWDNYLNDSNGTCIPIDYVWPSKPSSVLWQKYLNK
jgi:hypothetical protein